VLLGRGVECIPARAAVHVLGQLGGGVAEVGLHQPGRVATLASDAGVGGDPDESRSDANTSRPVRGRRRLRFNVSRRQRLQVGSRRWLTLVRMWRFNIGLLGLATGDYIAVVNNDCCLAEGDVYDLCVPETVTSPTADRAGGKGHGAGLFPHLARSPGVRHHR
jgi:hypothetical protein